MAPAPFDADAQRLTRRALLGRAGWGLAALALADLWPRRLWSGDPPSPTASGAADGIWPGVVHPLHFPPRAKRVIWLTMMGGPSQLETFDWKPKLQELHGKPMPESMTAGQQLAQLQGQALRILGPRFRFARYGQSQQEISELFPHLAQVADELCIIRSMQTESINHDPAQLYLNTGTVQSGRPAMGAWVTYGLGTLTADLPGFVVLSSTGGGPGQTFAARQWQNGCLPSRFQGVHLYSTDEPVLYVRTPAGISDRTQRAVVDAVHALDQERTRVDDDPEITARITQYEMAFRMQTAVPELMDLRREDPRTLARYGAVPGDGSYASNCLLARRLAERGVRFIQLYHRDWDHHLDLTKQIRLSAEATDQATAALILDLKERGLLEDTLVVWGGEFGRTPMAQGDDGRDHHIQGFTMWCCGGGVRRGMTFGATDELGYRAIQDPVSVHDLHATMLRLLGIDHTRLTVPFQGREVRLTDIAGKVVEPILA